MKKLNLLQQLMCLIIMAGMILSCTDETGIKEDKVTFNTKLLQQFEDETAFFKM